MFERFTDRARRVTVLAQEEARLLGWREIPDSMFLAGCIHEGEGVAAKALQKHAVTLDAVRGVLRPGEAGEASGHIPFTAGCRDMLSLSLREALQFGHNYIGTEHLLLALVRADGPACDVLRTLDINPQDIRATVIELLAGYSAVPLTDAALRYQRALQALRVAEAEVDAAREALLTAGATAAFGAVSERPGD